MQLPASLLALLYAVLTPAAATIDLLPSNNASLLWGPYRPNLYTGIRARLPNTLIAGLMWGKLEDIEKSM